MSFLGYAGKSKVKSQHLVFLKFVNLVHTSIFISETASRKGRIEIPKRAVVSGMGRDFPLADCHCISSLSKYWSQGYDPWRYIDIPEWRGQAAWPMQAKGLCSWVVYGSGRVILWILKLLKILAWCFVMMKLKRGKWYQEISTFRNKKQFWLTVQYYKCALSKLLKDTSITSQIWGMPCHNKDLACLILGFCFWCKSKFPNLLPTFMLIHKLISVFKEAPKDFLCTSSYIHVLHFICKWSLIQWISLTSYCKLLQMLKYMNTLPIPAMSHISDRRLEGRLLIHINWMIKSALEPNNFNVRGHLMI